MYTIPSPFSEITTPLMPDHQAMLFVPTDYMWVSSPHTNMPEVDRNDLLWQAIIQSNHTRNERKAFAALTFFCKKIVHKFSEETYGPDATMYFPYVAGSDRENTVHAYARHSVHGYLGSIDQYPEVSPSYSAQNMAYTVEAYFPGFAVTEVSSEYGCSITVHATAPIAHLAATAIVAA